MSLIPNYIDIDYVSLKERLKTLMKNSETFKDYNYEGSNITMLIELMSYLSELNTYYTNKVAKNIYPETADLYQTIHSIAGIKGYNPKGYIAGKTDIQISVNLKNINDNDQLYVPAWYFINSGLSTDNDEDIFYSTTQPFTHTVETTATSGSYDFSITMKQGKYKILSYTADDIIDNKIVLPFFNFDHDLKPFDTNPAIALYVNGEPWERVENFVVDVSNTSTSENYYQLEYDKYERYNIRFSSIYHTPNDNDKIEIIILETLGNNGSISSNILTEFENTQTIPIIENDEIKLEEKYFIYNLTQDDYILEENISITNPEASIKASNPENIEEIKNNSKSNMTTQYRTITPDDYGSFLESHTDIIAANAWGEKEENPGNTLEYNKIYLTVIPDEWGSSKISIKNQIWSTETEGVSATVYTTQEYNDSLKNDLLDYISNRKHLNTYEEFILPELIFFAFDIGIKTKRMYNWISVKEDIKEKLEYYFSLKKRSFNETIDFKELHNFLLNENEISDTNNFPQIKGINNLVIRDVLTYVPSWPSNNTKIYEYNEDKNQPMFVTSEYDNDYENILRPIKLGLKQFPVLSIDNCVFLNEG